MLSGMSLLAFRTTERAPGSRSGQRAVLEQELDMVSDCAAAGRLRIASLFGKAPQAAISVRAWGRGRRSSFTLHRDRRSCVPVSMLLRKDNKRSSTTSWPARRPPAIDSRAPPGFRFCWICALLKCIAARWSKTSPWPHTGASGQTQQRANGPTSNPAALIGEVLVTSWRSPLAAACGSGGVVDCGL